MGRMPYDDNPKGAKIPKLNDSSTGPTGTQTGSTDGGTGTQTSGTTDQKMSTAGNKSLPGTAAGQASGGASSEGETFHSIERPLSIHGNSISTYRKVHKFMTFGLAPKVISGKNTNDRWMTTYLAEIPWHVPAFYMTPSEYNLLRPGAECVGLELKVIYRGSTIQFETASSSTSLATLNQINDIAFGVALNKTGIGSNVSFTAFDSTQPMLPNGVARPRYQPIAGKYRGLVSDFYGDNNDSSNFGGNIPHHQMGRQTFLYNYFALSSRKTGTTDANTDMYGGWPTLTEHIQQLDGKTVVNQPVCTVSYKPKMGLLNSSLKSLGHGLPYPAAGDNISIPICSSLAAGRVAVIQRDKLDTAVPKDAANGERWTTAESTAFFSNDDAKNPTIPIWDIYSPIEKDQIQRRGLWGDAPMPDVQPSVHVGVQPVPSLSTAALLAGSESVFNSWTDTRAYWEVVAVMHVKEYTPTHLPYAKIPNVRAGNVIQTLQTGYVPGFYKDAGLDCATFNGLYPMADSILDAAS